MAGPTAHAIQSFLAPAYGRPAILYRNAAPEGCDAVFPWDVPVGEAVEFHSYFNIFYPDMWRKHAQVGRLGLAVALTGAARVEVVASASGDVLAAADVSGAETIWLDLPEASAGHLFARLITTGQTRLDGMAWVTDRAPDRAPTLSVGLCSFNREDDLAVTLGALAEEQDRNPAIARIWVVNQGTSFSDPRIAALEARPGVTIVEQPNYGGCGGFTRSLMESIHAEDATSHHILMDDDIKLDPRALTRCLEFLAYAVGDPAVGGQMIDRDNPTTLFEGGGKLHEVWFVESLGRGLDLTSDAGMSFFDEVLDTDYNAWWFCMIPTEAIRRVGLPTPIFIRGDDIEYGCRLAAGGTQTLALPGAAVWHESFLHKKSDWLTYYDLRNRIYLATLYPEIAARPAAYYILGFVMVALFQHRYRAAEMTILAIRDTIGATEDAIGTDSESRHVALMNALKALPDYDVLAPDALPATRTGKLRELNPSIPVFVWMVVRAFVLVHFTVLLRRLRKPVRFPHVPEPSAVAAQDYIVPQDPEATRFVHYKARIGAMWSLTARAIVVCVRYGFTPKSKFAKLADELNAARDEARWRKMFALPRDRY